MGDKSSNCVFCVRVLIGKYTKGWKGLKVLPPKQEVDWSDWKVGINCFDTVVDDENYPQHFLVFDYKQCNPEYLINFK